MRVQYKSHQAHHHAFVGFGWMAGQGEGMVPIVLAIYVGNVN